MAENHADAGPQEHNGHGAGLDSSSALAFKTDPSDGVTVTTTASDMDDDISVTSTVYPDESDDHEYEVDDILAEELDADGVMKYLVKWKGYPLEMCTWEPRENFSDEVLEDIWEQKKRQPGFEPFDLSALDEAQRAKGLRHLRRNRKRRQLGLPETSPVLEAVDYTPDHDLSDRDGAAEALPVAAAAAADDEASAAAAAAGAADAAPATSLVLATTEIPDPTEVPETMEILSDSDDDLIVLDAISAPPSKKKKKKKKKSLDLTAEERATAVPKKKKAKEDKDKDKDKGKDSPKKKTSLSSLRGASSTTSAGAVQSTDPKSKLPERRVSTDRPGKTAASSLSSSLAPFSEKLANNIAKPKTTAASTAKEPAAPKDAVSASPSSSSSSLPAASTAAAEAPGAKVFSAKKSGPASQQGAGANAFSGGKRSRAGRTSLIAVATDPNKPQQLFEHISTRRRIELLERDKPDRAIEPSQLTSALFPIAGGPPANNTSSSSSTSTSTAARSASNATTTESPIDVVAAATTGSVPRGIPARTSLKKPGVVRSGDARKRKWVRFANADSSESGNARLKSPPMSRRDSFEEMDVDEDIPMYGGAEPDADEFAPAEPQPAVPLPSVTLKLLFGTQTEPVDATLDVVAQNGSTQQLLDQILAVNQTLRFGNSFLAATLQQQLNGIRKENLFSGNIRPRPDTDTGTGTGVAASSSASVLQTVKQRLKLMASGLVLLRPDHAIVVYPTQCDDWVESRIGFPEPVDADSTVSLRYVVFSTLTDCAALLRPPGDTRARFGASPGDHDRRQVMQQFFQLDKKAFDDLLPDEHHDEHQPQTKPPPTRFFLAFPPTAKPFMFQIALWLRDMDADSVILFSTHPGAWMSFVRDVEQAKLPGVVIVHELVTGAVRQFPYFHRLVRPGTWNCRVWSISQGTYASPIFYPIVGPNNDDIVAPIGRISWTELFPSGLAILLTPSVILSEPLYVYNIMRWVAATARCGRAPVTLVAAWDLCSYMREVADEKWHMCKELYNAPDPAPYRTALRVGAADKHCLRRDEAWVLATELCDRNGQKVLSSLHTPAWPRAVTLADPAIDPNDEESLVCWFGWWSTLYMDQYRAFYVLGTERKNPWLHIMSHTIRVPNFAPEAAPEGGRLPAATSTEAQTVALPAAAYAVKPRGTSRTEVVPTAPRRAAPVRRHPLQPLTLHATQLRTWNRACNFWKIFGFVVWWRDADESFRYGHMDSSNHTIADWFKYTWSFNYQHKSYLGLFSLVDGPDEAAHPFVAVWRPVMPHLQHVNRDETELIFWDARGGDRIPGSNTALYELDDLTPGQQAVVDYVRQHGGEKNPGTHLAKVWTNCRASSWVEEPSSPTYNAMDRTMGFLASLAEDFRTVMPPMPTHLTSRGYKLLRPGHRNGEGGGGGAGGGVDGSASTRRDSPMYESDNPWVPPDNGPQPVRMLFHPPGGSRHGPTGPTGPTGTRFVNNLYESVRALKKQDPGATVMTYTFRPTMEWYRALAEAGRGFEHIVVETADAVCAQFGISTAAPI